MKFPKPTKRSKPKSRKPSLNKFATYEQYLQAVKKWERGEVYTQPKSRKRPRRQRKGTPAAMAREADRLWSKIVRASGHCAFPGLGIVDPPHGGSLQAAHGFSRRYRNTRWLPINGFCLCAAHHVYFTYRPLEWDDWIRWQWGGLAYNELRLLALRTTKPDVAAALDKLRAEAAARGIV